MVYPFQYLELSKWFIPSLTILYINPTSLDRQIISVEDP